jgi:non-reducing end alpha-L-arabinofuranosidase
MGLFGCSSSAGNSGSGGGNASAGVASSGGKAETGGASQSGGSTGSASTSGAAGTSTPGGQTGAAGVSGSGGSAGGSSGGAGTSGSAGAAGASSKTAGTSGSAGAAGGSSGGAGTSGSAGAAGGSSKTAGTSGAAGATGGSSKTAGTSGSAGVAGGSSGGAGTSGAGGSISGGTLPGDVAKAAGTPVVAAHALTRILFASYTGPLFKALRVSDKQEKDIEFVAATGLVDTNALSTFCSGTTCKVTTLYDQSGNGNDMWRGDSAANAPMSNNEAPKLCDLMDIEYWQMSDGTKVPIALEHGWESNLLWKGTSQCLRNRDKSKNIPTLAKPLTTYAIFHGKYVNSNCCFNYGSTGNRIHYTGPGTLAALTLSKMTFWTKGTGSGPWVMVDWEQGVYTGNTAKCNSGVPAGTTCTATGENANPSIPHDIVTALMKHNGVDHWALKAGNAKTGELSVSADLPALPKGYSPLKQEGGLGLGEGGAGDSGGSGGFSEGAVIAGETTDATDNAIQKSIVSVYGK